MSAVSQRSHRRVAPRRLTRTFGVPEDRITPELDYMNRVFGVRAVTLGVGYLAWSGDARRLWQCDRGTVWS